MNEKRKRHGLRLTLLGAAIGLVGSLALTRWTCTSVDQTPPTIAACTPAPRSTVTNLVYLTVTFSEEVSGLDAADLRVNGPPAAEVSGAGSNYIFKVSQPPPGTISISWATNHDIFDLAAPPNGFNRTAPESEWSFILDTRIILIQSNSMWRFVKGTNKPSVPTDAWRQPGFDDAGWSNSPAPFFYGDPYDSAQYPGTLLNDMPTNYSTVYLRTELTVLNRALVTNLWLNAQSDDGFIAWINGVEIRRYNVPAGELPHIAFANGDAPEPQSRGAAYILTALPLRRLRMAGTCSPCRDSINLGSAETSGSMPSFIPIRPTLRPSGLACCHRTRRKAICFTLQTLPSPLLNRSEAWMRQICW